MKKILYSIFIFTSLVILLGSCEPDNFPYPDTQFYGAIRDSVGGGLVETEMVNGSTIGAYEQGFETPVLQTWYIKESGEFRNNLVFSGTYDIQFASCNFFPYNVDNLVIAPGEVEHDFLVVPYLRIKNCTITHDAGNNRINASFTLEAGKSSVRGGSITLYAFTDIHVGSNVKFSIATGTGQPTRSLGGAVIDPATVYNLSIDLSANSTLFHAGRNYYFRVGAQAVQSGVGTVRPNYAPCVKITL